MLSEDDEDEDAILEADKGVQIEKIRKDISSLSTEDKLQLLEEESPELLQFLQDFQQNITQVTEKMKPLLLQVKNADFPTDKGVSYLEVKFRILKDIPMNFLLLL